MKKLETVQDWLNITNLFQSFALLNKDFYLVIYPDKIYGFNAEGNSFLKINCTTGISASAVSIPYKYFLEVLNTFERTTQVSFFRTSNSSLKIIFSKNRVEITSIKINYSLITEVLNQFVTIENLQQNSLEIGLGATIGNIVEELFPVLDKSEKKSSLTNNIFITVIVEESYALWYAQVINDTALCTTTSQVLDRYSMKDILASFEFALPLNFVTVVSAVVKNTDSLECFIAEDNSFLYVKDTNKNIEAFFYTTVFQGNNSKLPDFVNIATACYNMQEQIKKYVFENNQELAMQVVSPEFISALQRFKVSTNHVSHKTTLNSTGQLFVNTGDKELLETLDFPNLMSVDIYIPVKLLLQFIVEANYNYFQIFNVGVEQEQYVLVLLKDDCITVYESATEENSLESAFDGKCVVYLSLQSLYSYSIAENDNDVISYNDAEYY